MLNQQQDTATIKLVLVDDNATFRSCLGRAFKAESNLVIVATAATGAEALELPGSLAPDIVLLDVHLPDRFGINLIAPLKALWPRCKVIMLTFEDALLYYTTALAAGATDLVVKSNAAIELVPSIAKAMVGRATG